MVANCEIITRLVILIIFREKIVKLKVFLKKKNKVIKQPPLLLTYENFNHSYLCSILFIVHLSFIDKMLFLGSPGVQPHQHFYFLSVTQLKIS